MAEPIRAWHFLRDDRRLQFPPHTLVKPGQTLRVEPPLDMCRRGLHASRGPLDALYYAPDPIVCRVRLSGEILDGGDKLCASERTVLWMADATKVLHEFACWCAEQALLRERAAGREPDPRCWAAVKAKRTWLRGEIDDATLEAARSAVWSITWSAAQSATRNVARNAACDTTWVSWHVAAAAARAWWDSSWDDVWEAQNTELERRLMELKPREGGKGDD